MMNRNIYKILIDALSNVPTSYHMANDVYREKTLSQYVEDLIWYLEEKKSKVGVKDDTTTNSK